MTLLEENAEILAGLQADGNDLGPSRPIDFSHVFPDQASAEGFAALAQREGFQTEIFLEDEFLEDRHGCPWDVTATKEMEPSADKITAWEERLDKLAQAHGGRPDGWGFFRA